MKKKLALAGIAAFMLICTALVFAQSTEDQYEGFRSCGGMRHRQGMFGSVAGFHIKEKMGLPQDANMERFRGFALEDLGLPEDSTREEIREALEERRIKMYEEQLQEVKEKLGLSEDATEEEVLAALEEWREENKVLLGFGSYRTHRHFRGPRPMVE